MNARAYAKINWFLHISSKRPDGYHNLEMIMQHIDLYDDIFIEPLSDERLDLSIVGNQTPINPEHNLVVKAARALQAHSQTDKGARFVLEKRIPIGAGLGGGSADAAATLLALNKLWGLHYSLDQLQQIGLAVGADIPYCLESGPALVTGIGGSVQPINLGKEAWLIILKPEASLSTKDVFAAERHNIQSNASIEKTMEAIAKEEYELLHQYSKNDLQEPASRLLEDIYSLITALKENGATFTQMSGSGSAVYGVFNNQNEAESAFNRIHTPGFRVLTRTLNHATAVL